MIKCLYCGYECPDTALLCPNCGKAIIRPAVDRPPTFEDIKEALRQEQTGVPKENLLSQKQIVLAACLVLLLALLLIYKVF